MWYVGQKVVCTNGTPSSNRLALKENFPIAGKVYTIRDIKSGLAEDNQLSFLLEEITNRARPYIDGTYELHFLEKRFKPLEENKTDISIFTEMLNKAPVQGRENLKKLQEKKKELTE